jgi:hypothetical protein
MFCRAVVQQALVSGMEIWNPTREGLKRLEARICGKLRYLLQGEAAGHTNDWVRHECGIHTVSSILQQRRLVFLRSILTMLGSLQDDDSDVPAWLFGDGCMHHNHKITA